MAQIENDANNDNNNIIKLEKKTYADNCNTSNDCNENQLLVCASTDGLCDCPVLSYANFCDCSKGLSNS